MSSFLLSVEGISDQGAFEGLNTRLSQIIKSNQTNGNRPNKICGYFKHRSGFSKYILCKDLHTFPIENINKIYNEAKGMLDDYDKPIFEKLVIQNAIEAWFLSDIDAINYVFNCNITTNVANPESIENPDDYLTNLLRKQGKEYIKSKEISKRIMMEMDLGLLQSKCSSYQDFINIIT